MVKCFQINPLDNTAILLDNAAAGDEIEILGGTGTIVLKQDIQYGHKVALARIPLGKAVFKYGISIGKSTQHIAAGEWVHLHNCASNYDERSASLDLHTGAVTDTIYK